MLPTVVWIWRSVCKPLRGINTTLLPHRQSTVCSTNTQDSSPTRVTKLEKTRRQASILSSMNMSVDLSDMHAGSTRSLFRSNTAQSNDIFKTSESNDALKALEIRSEKKLTRMGSGTGRLRAISRLTWGSVFRGVRASREQPSVLDEFQHKLHLNSDTVVAVLELAIILLSCVQLELSSRSPRWRGNKVCVRHPHCVELEDEGSFIVPNCIRASMGLLAIIRLWVRVRFLLKHRLVAFHGQSWFKRTAGCRMYVWEFLGIVIFPYPGLERVLNRNQADIMILLSIAVGFRTICWRYIMFFPYPIRQKTKVESFAGNLEFFYREFVFKKVMDDHPIRKIVLMTSILLMFATFLVRSIESINCVCTPLAQFAGQTLIDARHLNCMSMSWGDAIWFVSTSFMAVGFGDIVPKSKAARLVIVVSSGLMRILAATLASVFIKKSHFSTMEARVHSFLFRMDLFNKKDLSAVMAVQASFRFTKSYKRSLKWHKHHNSLLYYRPLSTRLPNEVKKKLYVSRFQSSLKDIIKFNTDGDPVNAFIKHIEVITAALGITLVEMAQLKKVYRYKSRLLSEKQKRAAADQSALALVGPPSPSQPATPRQSRINSPGKLTSATTTTASAGITAEWGHSMVNRCEQVLAELYRLELTVKTTCNPASSTFEGL